MIPERNINKILLIACAVCIVAISGEIGFRLADYFFAKSMGSEKEVGQQISPTGELPSIATPTTVVTPEATMDPRLQSRLSELDQEIVDLEAKKQKLKALDDYVIASMRDNALTPTLVPGMNPLTALDPLISEINQDKFELQTMQNQIDELNKERTEILLGR